MRILCKTSADPAIFGENAGHCRVHGVHSSWSGPTQGDMDVLHGGERMEFLERPFSSPAGWLVAAKRRPRPVDRGIAARCAVTRSRVQADAVRPIDKPCCFGPCSRVGGPRSRTKALPTTRLHHFAIEQCPPLLAWPEPAAIRGGSLRRSTGSEARKSQAKKALRLNQKTACNLCVALMRCSFKTGSGDARARQ